MINLLNMSFAIGFTGSHSEHRRWSLHLSWPPDCRFYIHYIIITYKLKWLYLTVCQWTCPPPTSDRRNAIFRLHRSIAESPQHDCRFVQTASASRPRLRLRSSSSTDYVLPRLRTNFGERAFSHAGPSAWNSLPEDIRAKPDVTNFRKLLKTHYFNYAFNVQ